MPDTLNTIEQKIKADNDLCLRFIAGITEEQFNAKPKKAWSIAEMLEHVVLTEKMIFMLLRRPSNQQENTTFLLGEKLLEEKLIKQRDKKLNAPEALLPKGLFGWRAAGEEAFMGTRLNYLHALQNKSITLTKGVHKHPYLGAMSVADWLLFIVFHRQRHFIQAEEDLVSGV